MIKLLSTASKFNRFNYLSDYRVALILLAFLTFHVKTGKSQTLINETFESNDALPGALPVGWGTNEVYAVDSSSISQAFKIYNTDLINASGRWGIPSRTGSTRFAAANDRSANCDCIYQNSYLETPPLDFTGVTSPGMRFVIFNDDYRIGATAFITYSKNNGLTWTAVPYYPNTTNTLPEHPSQWKMVTLNLDTLINEPNVRIRFNWYDADEFTNGIAIDDVYIGSLSQYSISNERLNYGNYVAPNFSPLHSSYTMIPLSQAHAVSATSMVYNNGLLPVSNVQLSMEIEQNGVSLGSWSSSTLPQLDYLRKEYLTAQSNFVPAEIGNYSITSEVSIQNPDGTLNDDQSTTSFQITECTYALDRGDAIGGYIIDPGQVAGNVFDIYNTDSFRSVQASIYTGTSVGTTLYATISEIISYDTTTEEVNTALVAGGISVSKVLASSDLTTSTQNSFVCFDFPEPVLLQAGKKYFVAVQGDSTFYTSISGASDLERCWIVNDTTYSSLNRAMMIRLQGNCSSPCLSESNTGCTDPLASNYNPASITDDGSCLYTNTCSIETPLRPAANPCAYPNDWAMALFSLPSAFRFYTIESGQLTRNPDESVSIEAVFRSQTYPTSGWFLNMKLSQGLTWQEWSSQSFPTSYTADCGTEGANHPSWLFYLIQSQPEYELTGYGVFAGSALNIAHAPSNNYFATQIGDGANNYNNDYGLKAWFSYSGNFYNPSVGSFQSIAGAGDLAFKLNCCINDGLPCDDNNVCTVNDVIGEDCVCIGETNQTLSFNPIPIQCVGAIASALPTTSIEGVTGTWVPSSINTSSAGTSSYTFSPSENCYPPYQVLITVDDFNPNLDSYFNGITGYQFYCENGYSELYFYGIPNSVITYSYAYSSNIDTIQLGPEGLATVSNLPYSNYSGPIFTATINGCTYPIDYSGLIVDDFTPCGGWNFQIVANDTTLECSDFIIDQPLPYTVSGGCSNPLVSYNDQVVQYDPCLTIIERTWYAFDDCGNQANAVTLITLVDSTPPVFINLENEVIVECGSTQVLYPFVYSADNCDDNPTIYYFAGDTIRFDECPSNYNLYSTITTSDQCGNSVTEPIYIQQIDSQPPVFDPNNQTDFYFNYGEPISLPTPVTLDNCSENVNLEMGAMPAELWYPCNTYYQQWIATDECGNTSFFTQNIHIGIDPNSAPTPCDDNNPCTINDIINADCVCQGTTISCASVIIEETYCIGLGHNVNGRVEMSTPIESGTLTISNSCTNDQIVLIGPFTSPVQFQFSYLPYAETCEISILFSQGTVAASTSYSPTCCANQDFFFTGNQTHAFCVNEQANPIESILGLFGTPNTNLNYQWYLDSNQGLEIIPGATNSTFIPPTISAGTYHYVCSITDSNGCEYINPTHVVHVVNGNDFSGSISDKTICSGYTVALTPSVNYLGGEYLWSNDSTNAVLEFAPTTDTQLTVQYTIGNCVNFFDTVNVFVNELPSVTLQSQLICAGESTVLTTLVDGLDSNVSGTFLWSNNATSQSIIVSPAQATTYSVTYTPIGCTTGQDCIDPSLVDYCSCQPVLNCPICDVWPTSICSCNNEDYFTIFEPSYCTGNYMYTFGQCSNTSISSSTASATISVTNNCGCTDPLAANYNPNAIADDGSCTYGECYNYQMIFTPRPCVYDPNIGEVAPAFFVRYLYNGPCNVETVVITDEFGVEFPFNTSASSDSSGGILGFVYLTPSTTYELYLVMSDGTTSPVFTYFSGECGGTICDCDGNQHTESVTLWLGDTYADNGSYTLNGSTVNFNCETWGYDCGDIVGIPNIIDPYGVCNGSLPPNNGCVDILSIVAENISIECDDAVDNINYPITVTGACDENYTVTYTDAPVIIPNACNNYINRTWTVIDNCGNSATTASIIFIEDNTPPVFASIPEGGTYSCNDLVPLEFPTYFDNCDNNPTITYIDTENINLGCNSSYILRRVFRITDDCGNSSTVWIDYTIIDDEPPVFLSSNQTDFYFNFGDEIILPNPAASDNCSPTVYIQSVLPALIWMPCTDYSVLYTATDDCGNQSIFTQYIHIGGGDSQELIPCDDNNPCTVNDVINADCVCQGTNTGANCNFIEITDTFCEGYFFELHGSVHVSNPPSSGTLTITSSCGGSVLLNAPFDNVMDFVIYVYSTDFANCTLTAVFSEPGAPSISSVNYTKLPCCTIPELIDDLPTAVTACQNSNNTPLSVSVSGTDYFISWYVSELPNGPFSLISGANSTTYYPPTDVASTMYYRCIVTVSALACEVGDVFGGPYISTTCAYTVTPGNTSPTFGTFGPYCAGSTIPPLPTTSTNGIQGTWSPAINNQATTTYTFTPSSGQCASSITSTITINSATTPSFTFLNEYCAGTSIQALPTTSNNGIQGTWSPAINNQATTTYTFTPSAGQCASSITRTITINSNVIPMFNAVSAYCSGSNIPALPTTSINGVTGSWSPDINNTQTTSYTFTPDANQCASQVFLTIAITPGTTPTFGDFGPYCAGSTIPPLPTTSTNGIQGLWSPSINNQATTTYTFTPNSGQCANSITRTIIINQNLVPTFNNPGPYCENSAFPPLPTVSTNGINGSWTPAVNNQTTATYIFTPNNGECASSVDLTVNIIPSDNPSFTVVDNYCQGETIPPLPTTSNNGVNGSWSPAINNQVTTAYVFTPTAGQCASIATQTITIGSAVTAQITVIGNNTELSCNNPQITLVASGGSSYSWSGGLGNSSIAIVTDPGTYTVTASSSAGCSASASVVISQAVSSPPFAGNDGNVQLCSNGNVTNLFNALGGLAQAGGVWNGPSGILAGGLYNPNIHQAGVYAYVVTDAGNCSSDTAFVTVSEQPFVQPMIDYDSPFCLDTLLQSPTMQSPSGGVFSVSPANGLDINANGVINTESSTPGTYSVTYSINTVCAASISTLVIVEQAPTPLIFPTTIIVCPGETEVITATGGTSYLWSDGSTNSTLEVDTSDVGSYYVEVTNEAGCTSQSNSFTVIAGTISPASITVSGQPSICAGESIDLVGSGGSSWLWSNGATTQTITVDEIGDYWVAINSASGCTDTSEIVTITYGNGVTISASGPTTFCEGGSVTLTAEPDDLIYAWGTGATSQSITVTESGYYQVSTVNPNGCGGEAQVIVNVIPYPNNLTIPPPTLCGGASATLCASPADEVVWTSSADPGFESNSNCIAVDQGGLYTAVMTNGNLCTTTDDVLVEAIPFYVYYLDNDGDGFGNDQDTIHACEAPIGYDSDPGDCDDTNAGINPVSNEVCGDIYDNNCDGVVNEDCEVFGCTDESACATSYNPTATVDDGTCTYPGCTDASASNYDATAGCDDGSCQYGPPVEGCMDVSACNYDEQAMVDDGSCVYPGCMDPAACNYNMEAGCDNGLCDYLTLYAIQGDSLYQTPEAFCETSYWYPSTPGSTYTWNAPGGTVDAQMQGTDSIVVFWADQGLGSVTVYETTTSGCIGTLATLSVTIQPNPDNSCTTGVDEQSIIQISAYPNPTTGNFTLQTDESVRGTELMVYDALGKLILQKPLQQLQTTIESDNWAAGVYTLLIRTLDDAASLRVIKE